MSRDRGGSVGRRGDSSRGRGHSNMHATDQYAYNNMHQPQMSHPSMGANPNFMGNSGQGMPLMNPYAGNFMPGMQMMPGLMDVSNMMGMQGTCPFDF